MSNPTADDRDSPPHQGSSFRGGFSTSLYDGLLEHHGHSDCCVLTCCGIFLYDRNEFLLTDKRPSWKGRCGVLVCLLLLILTCFVTMAVATYLYQIELEHLKDIESEGKSPTEEDSARMGEVQNLLTVAQVCRRLIWIGAIYLLFKAGQYRYRSRRFLMARLYQERNPSGGDEVEEAPSTTETPLLASTNEAMNQYLNAEKYNICCATTPLGCIPKDAILEPSNAAALERDTNQSTDFCHCFVKTLSSLCCGACCGCWIQCLGLCAIAQEDRELQRILPKAKFEMDYITFQPFAEYFPKLQALRENKVNNMLSHFSELSQLSRQLLRSTMIVLALLTVVAFSGVDPLFQPSHLLVVCMTLLQAFLIVYFVHWQWNRFDLSVDAVIKYFASGFILCTANAFVYETFVQTSLSFTVTLVSALMDGSTPEIDDEGYQTASAGADAVDEADQAKSQPIWLLFIMAFLNAFLVASLVEEVSKYFGFWMVEHPDLALPNDASDPATASPHRTLKSIGAGITVAMVTTAVGFACCENFVYVFVYSRTANAANELVTLVARSIFPVHPLAAAIQSIGVCLRDVEKDSSVKLGRILLPALILHGSFDFALMFLDYLSRSSWKSPGDEDDTNIQDQAATSLDNPSAGLGQALPALISSVSIVLIGVIYYIVKALAQRKRLEELDKRRQGNGEYERLV